MNRADALPFLDAAKGECRMYLEPPPPPTARERREWIVSLFGREEGPFTLNELETGFVEVTDGATGVTFEAPLLPATLVARVVTQTQTQTIAYGATSRYQARVDEWNARHGARFASARRRRDDQPRERRRFATTSPKDAGDGCTSRRTRTLTDANAEVPTSSLAFIPLAAMPGMGAAARTARAPPGGGATGCTARSCPPTSRRDHHRERHGRGERAGGPGVEPAGRVHLRREQRLDGPEVPVLVGRGVPERAHPSTCPRVWFAERWVDDGWFVGNNVFRRRRALRRGRGALALRRRLARLAAVGEDYGGGGPRQYGDSGANIYNAYEARATLGRAVPGPPAWTPPGRFPWSRRRPAARMPMDLKPYVTDETFAAAGAARCYGAARVAPRNSAGAIWLAPARARRGVGDDVRFVLSERRAVRERRRGEPRLRRRDPHALRHVRGEGRRQFAFVVWDADADEAALEAANIRRRDERDGAG